MINKMEKLQINNVHRIIDDGVNRGRDGIDAQTQNNMRREEERKRGRPCV